MRTKISIKGMILRLRQEKYRKNLAVFRCYDLGRQIVITRKQHSCIKYFFSCRSSERISKFHIPSESYENIDFVQWNDYAIKTGKI